MYDNFKQIKRIDFDIFGNDEIKRQSALGSGPGITNTEIYENGKPKKDGLCDPRLGTCTNDILCATCLLSTNYCVGHFGHIDLAEVVFHIDYLPYVQKVLSCICPRCSKLLVYKNEDEFKEILKMKSGIEKMTYIRSISKNVSYCQNPNYGCGAPIPKIKVEIKKTSAVVNIIAETDLDNKEDPTGRKKLRQILTPDIIYDILKNISDDDCRILGIDPTRSRPEDMIHKIFPVPPNSMRPSARGDYMGGSSMEDDLTHKLADILKANNRIIRNKENQTENSSKYNVDHTNLLQYHVGTYIENDSMSLPKSEQKGKIYKSLATRLKGKTGRVRGNLMGKRGDFTGRTVITSDPTIGNNQLGVPVKIAMNLTFPEVVNRHNIEFLSKLVRNGKDTYPGANFVFPISKMRKGDRLLPIFLGYSRESIELAYGDIVERHMLDGDIVLLNRQPTLHKQSMMGHRIKVINDPTLMTYRLSVAITTPYNADFDGDEMNVFLPESLQTQIELEEIACVEKQIITPTTSKTIVGIVQDGLLGAYNLTSPTIRIDWRNAMNIMSYTSLEDFSVIKKNKEYSGSELYSLIIPPGINISKSTLKIKNGQLIEGRLSKDVLGAGKKNNLVQLIWDGYGVEDTKKFIDNTQRLINNFNLWHGFSVGTGDIYLENNLYEQINEMFKTKELKVEQMITEMENNPEFMPIELFEHKLFSELNIVRDNVSKLIVENMSPTNAFHIMTSSGSKGDVTNIGQMAGCLGLQAFEGKIMPKKYNNRTLSYFHQHDDRAVSRGLVKQPFVRGLEFPEFVFHLMASRIGLIDTAIKTAQTGYTQRKLIKSMEDIMVKYDGTIRNANDRVIQYVYGDSGSDTTKQYEYFIKLIEMNNQEITSKYLFTTQELETSNGTTEDNDEIYNTVIKLRDIVRYNIQKARMNYIILVTDFMLPININRIVDTINGQKMKSSNNLTPKYILEQIEKLLSNDKTTLVNISTKNKKNNLSLKMKDEILHKTILKTALYDAIHPKRILIDLGFNKAQFDKIIDELSNNFDKNMIEPGEMVGIIAAQSCGEPLTQMSCAKDSKIIVRNKKTNEIICTEIGKFIDDLLDINKEKSIVLKNHKDSVVLHIDDYEIMSVQQNEKTCWSSISEISRHPANGNLIKIYTKTGRTVVTTKSHSHLKRTIDSIIPIEGSKLKVGDRIPIAKKIQEIDNSLKTINVGKLNVKLDHDFGWLCGAYIADGCLNTNTISVSKIIPEYQNKLIEIVKEIFGNNVKLTHCQGKYGIGCNMTFTNKNLAYFLKNNFGNGEYNKKISAFVFGSNINFISGILSGYFDGDGNIQADNECHCSIRISSRSKELIEGISILFTYFGITGSLLEEITKHTNKIQYNFAISRKYAEIFSENIKLTVKNKNELLNKIIDINYRDRDKVSNIDPNDMIPELGNVIAEIGKLLNLSGQSRTYGQWKKKEAIGRETLANYIEVFQTEIDQKINDFSNDCLQKLSNNMKILKQANESNVLWDKIISIDELDDPKEYVYDFTVPTSNTFMINSSVFVHNTLNSIDWPEKIMVKSETETTVTEIGKFIDDLLDNNKNKVQYLGDNKINEMENVQYLEIKNKNYKIKSVDKNGKVTWNRIEAITKHLPINKDGTNTLVKIKTRLGCEVVATKAKSFLTIVDNEIGPIRGDEIKIGTYLPIMKDFPDSEDTKYYDTTRYWYDNKYIDSNTELQNCNDNEIHNYNKYIQNMKQIKLDKNFGFVIGAYIANGQINDEYVLITNNNENFKNSVKIFADAYKIKIELVESNANIKLHSQLLSKLINDLCGNSENNKKVPDFAYTSTKEFANGLICGYFSENKTIESKKVITASSNSKELLIGISTLLTKFGIISQISMEKNNSISILIQNNNLRKFIELFESNSKNEREHEHENEHENKFDIYDEICLNNLVTYDFIKGITYKLIHSNVYFDQIISIEEVQPTKTYVYDFTVENDKNFCMFNKLLVNDSFHHSGIASMSATVQGVPRMNELLSVSKKPKTPQMVIYLEDQYMSNKDIAHKIASYIKHTTLSDIRDKINVYYDPLPKSQNGFMENDNVKHVFYQHKNTKSNCLSEITGLPWLMRIELNREKMLDKEVTLLEIKSKFCDWWEKRYTNTKIMKKEEKKVLNKITQLAVLSNSDNDKKPVLHIRFNVKDADKDKFDVTTIDNFIDFVVDKFKLKGINSITNIQTIQEERMITFNEKTGDVEKKTQYVIYAAGVNFNDIRYLTGIDLTKTISNNVIEIYNTFGIEIARSVLLREVTKAYVNEGKEVNYHHVSMIVDQMTATGTINSVDRHGMNKSDSDPLSRASFEKTVEQLLTAAVYGQSDHMKGVSSRIMVGSVIKGGTGYCELELDTDMIEKSEYTEESDYNKKFMELNKNTLANDIIEKKNDTDIFIPI